MPQRLFENVEPFLKFGSKKWETLTARGNVHFLHYGGVKRRKVHPQTLLHCRYLHHVIYCYILRIVIYFSAALTCLTVVVYIYIYCISTWSHSYTYICIYIIIILFCLQRSTAGRVCGSVLERLPFIN